ncbi:MAG: Gfo/Idh/MocA family oxidoreductase [Planctomycetota bacterium]|jgi:predicted dehydrogenase|nr:Gfo/Idh/MocA family oxidoreductase [Planctomycetota bacterium]MDP6988048.1 Gfo/Idh/MocA family oxidoreductase [Planctomycetota bacterium]
MGGGSARAFRVAVAGVGHLGRIHARIWNEHPEAELVAVVDSDASRAGALAEELGCRACADASELPDDLDGVSVVVSTAAHADVAVGLLERGIACLVEKPLASDLEQADRILAAAEAGGALLAVGHVERFQPGVRAVREMAIAPRFIESHRLAPFSFRSLDVGVVHDLMIHDLDLVLYLCGSEVVSMDAAGGAILTEREDLASVRLVFENGARASVTASRASLTPMRRMRMFSSEGYVSLDFQENYGLMVAKGPEFDRGREALRELDPASLAQQTDWITDEVLRVTELELGGEQRPLQAELDSFLRSVRDGAEVEVTGADGRRALELADRIVADIGAQTW